MQRVNSKLLHHKPCPLRSTQPCIPPGSINRVPALAGGKGGILTSVGWAGNTVIPYGTSVSRSGEELS